MSGKRSLVQGLGVNDANYAVHPTIDGKQMMCKYYRIWSGMLRRGFNDKHKEKYPTYKDVTVSYEWKYFMTFRKWCVDYELKYNIDVGNFQLDKDIIVLENKEYNPEVCCFVDNLTNSFLIKSTGKKGSFLVGANWANHAGQFQSGCRNPFTGKREYLGLFTNELQAHQTWQAKKHEYALQLADLQHDPRVADALRKRYTPDTDWTKA